jgi:hypothetical protein
MGLEVYNNDVEELVEEHSQELTTAGLQRCIMFHRKKLRGARQGWRR